MYCSTCGTEINDKAIFCVKCGCPTQNYVPANTVKSNDFRVGYAISSKSRIVYIILALFVGALGIHNFYAGRIGPGVAQLLITMTLFWLIFPLFIVAVWALIEICTVTQDGDGNFFVS
jgi:Predicted membrane protein